MTIEEQLRYETVLSFVRDIASYEMGSSLDEASMLHDYVDQAKWLIQELPNL